jgi:hypothetical protein
MTNSWRIGGVQLQLREDGTFSIYQPDSNRVMPAEIAVEVACAILNAYPNLDPATREIELAAAQPTVGGGVIATSDGPTVAEDTSHARVSDISTSDGPQLTDSEAVASGDSSDAQRSDGLSVTELEADRNALETSAKLDVKDLLGQMTAEAHADGTDETVTDFGPARTEKPKPPVKRRPGRPRKTT